MHAEAKVDPITTFEVQLKACVLRGQSIRIIFVDGKPTHVLPTDDKLDGQAWTNSNQN